MKPIFRTTLLSLILTAATGQALAECRGVDCLNADPYTGSLSHVPPDILRRLAALKAQELELTQRALAAAKADAAATKAAVDPLKREFEALQQVANKAKVKIVAPAVFRAEAVKAAAPDAAKPAPAGATK